MLRTDQPLEGKAWACTVRNIGKKKFDLLLDYGGGSHLEQVRKQPKEVKLARGQIEPFSQCYTLSQPVE